jgi:hypothetical protein
MDETSRGKLTELSKVMVIEATVQFQHGTEALEELIALLDRDHARDGHDVLYLEVRE